MTMARTTRVPAVGGSSCNRSVGKPTEAPEAPVDSTATRLRSSSDAVLADHGPGGIEDCQFSIRSR